MFEDVSWHLKTAPPPHVKNPRKEVDCPHFKGWVRQGCCHDPEGVQCKKHGTISKLLCKKCQLEDLKVKISAIIPSYNEDPDKLQTTVTSMRKSLISESDLEIIVVDDGSDKPAKVEGAKLIRNEPGIGAMQSINRGLEIASGDVLTSWDSHMRLDVEGTLETMAEKALEDRCVVSLPSTGYRKKDSNRLRGCYIYWNLKDGIQPRWRSRVGIEPEWVRIPCMMGANYGMSRDTMEYLKSVTGRVWENVGGRWGFGEQSMAVKCFLMDVPTLLCQHHRVAHHYRNQNPLGGITAQEAWRNIAVSMATLLSPETYGVYFHPYVRQHLGETEAKQIWARCRDIERPWDTDKERKIFTQLLGFKASITEPHEDYKWMQPMLDSLETKPSRILVWRPSELVLELHRRYPDAKIECVEFSRSRSRNWRPILKDLGIPFHRTPWGRYAEEPKKLGTFDLIFICGDQRDSCRRTAKSVLREGGKIIESPTDMRNQLEHGERQKEITHVKDYSNDERTDHDFVGYLKEWVELRRPTRALVWGSVRAADLLVEHGCQTTLITQQSHKKTKAENVVEGIPAQGPSRYAVRPVIDNWDLFDFIFVDGRRRVECLIAAPKILSPGGVVVLHDAERKEYQIGLEDYDIVLSDPHQRTVMLRPK